MYTHTIHRLKYNMIQYSIKWPQRVPDPHDAADLRGAQVRADDDRAQCRNIGIPLQNSLCPVVLCPSLCGSEDHQHAQMQAHHAAVEGLVPEVALAVEVLLGVD